MRKRLPENWRSKTSRPFEGHGNNATRRSNPIPRRPLGLRALENLLSKDSEELIIELSNSKNGLLKLIQQNNLSKDQIVILIRIFRKVCDSSFDNNKYKIIQIYFGDDLFMKQLVYYIVGLSMQNQQQKRENQYFWNDPDDFWLNLIKISKELIDVIPTFSQKIIPNLLTTLSMSFPKFETQHNYRISNEIKTKVEELNQAVQTVIVNKDLTEELEITILPPDDFRSIPIYPTTSELFSESRPFLRKNIIKGQYQSVDHYLDVQFRLFREDFVGPLRTGINEYLHPSHNSKNENVKIYRKVHFLQSETINEQYCVRLKFNFSNKKQKFKYENSRRFMFGSLLCFTKDNFKTIIFGKVAERKDEDLEKGELIVGFDDQIHLNYNIDYLMVECRIYFEPYFHVLNVLQTMSIDNFPMEKYIINVNPNVHPPEYLTPETTYQIENFKIQPLLHNICNFYNFNESQTQAFKAALTQEFCIIQGPPGTGKTFLGLKIAKTLIKNYQVWYKKTPILIICYTNHALDQFLEGMTEFTDRIIRVGGQSKNEKLKSFNLNQQKHKFSEGTIQQRRKVKNILSNVKTITDNLKFIDMWNSIRNFQVFENIIPNYGNSWFYRARRGDILDWLLGQRDDTNAYVDSTRNMENIQVNDDNTEEFDNEQVDDDDNQMLQFDDIFEDIHSKATDSFPLITVSQLKESIANLKKQLDTLEAKKQPSLEEIIEIETTTFKLAEVQQRYDYLVIKLNQGKRKLTRNPPTAPNLQNPFLIPPEDRWNLYFHWLQLYKQSLLNKLKISQTNFREKYKTYEEMRDIENVNLMKNAIVIGMTTTGAARLHSSLQALKSPIVIVEEAAEVLEAHIITSITKHCQHLILIGDHQQLKPSTANFIIERNFNLNVSLFERMVINQIQLHTLNVQHRMRPEISNLITPTIYPNLENHESVLDRPMIKGLDNCLFFLDHEFQEEESYDSSKKNIHEAEFLIELAKHLILNNHPPESITIIAAYLGQMFQMQRLKQKYSHILNNIKIVVLDNYQGEENDIILLSLVRSNNEKRIGFLGIENRVCVALSRARNGLYIMGNMNQLCSQSELWRKIRASLETQNSIGRELKLRCQMHPDTVTSVRLPDDFLQISEGGCSRKCNADLICGHKCTSLCHIKDRQHLDYKCRVVCGKNLCDSNLEHLCRKTCYQDCGPCWYPVQRTLLCGHLVTIECHINVDTYNCETLVSTKLPCGHTVDKPCYRDAETFKCPMPCEIKVEPCGHACKLTCHIRNDPDHLEYKCTKKCAKFAKNCTLETDEHRCLKLCYEECELCLIFVPKKRSCGHFFKIPCSSDIDLLECTKPCKKILNCGHECKNKCSEPCGLCIIKVEKTILECGHKSTVKCHEQPTRKLCSEKCPLTLPCGHNCTKTCKDECTTKCLELVDCSIQSPCGHTITKIPCYKTTTKHNEEILLKYCNNPCSEVLKCEHKCSGTCSECYQGRIHKKCTEKCNFPLVCNHPCSFPCRLACQPCIQKCPYKCQHSSCGKKCGEICTPCTERCTRRCRHQQCTKLCGEFCNVPPCNQPCPRILNCGHLCIGFCGDPCPSKCLICHRDELKEIFFGDEDSEDARFVVLQDCGHVFESAGLERWMEQDGDKIGFKECPKCKTPIRTTQRFKNIIKKTMEEITKTKIKFYGCRNEILDLRKRLEEKLMTQQINSSVLIHRSISSPQKLFLQMVQNRLQFVKDGKRQPINKSELKALESKLQIAEHIENISGGYKQTMIEQIEFLYRILLRDEAFITNQEIDDFQYELNRLSRIVDLTKLQSRYIPDYLKTKLTQTKSLLFSFKKFDNQVDVQVVELLKQLNDSLKGGLAISEKEKREIIQAIGLKQGHWYKCPNGHPYAIGECGGAQQLSKCPDCGVPIGGTNHRLTTGNTVATEMDGARHGAWSEAANMFNYRL